MIYKYKILTSNDKDILYLYIDNSYEFSKENEITKRRDNIYKKISNFIKDNNIVFNGEKIMIVNNGIIIGSLNYQKDNIKYSEFINNFDKEHLELIDMFDPNELVNTYIQDDNYVFDKFIKTKDKNEHITYISFNDYLIYLINKEIPPSYEKEALKVYAVLIRTKLFKEYKENGFIKTEDKYFNLNLTNNWKGQYNKFIKKIKAAISDTNHGFLSYNKYYYDLDFFNKKYKISFNENTINSLAKQGYDYQEILIHFFPNCQLII